MLYAQTPTETRRVIDGGGGVASSSMFIAHASFHQPTPVGFTSNSEVLLSTGFLQSDTMKLGRDSDADGDGVNDWDELLGRASDPVTPTSPLLLDTDGDGASDAQEVVAGTNPTDPSQLLRIWFILEDPSGDVVDIRWTAREGRSYKLLCAESAVALRTNATIVAEGIATDGIGPWQTTMMSATNTMFSAEKKYYQIQTP